MVSIIVPVYNVEHYLDKCLHSLVTQSYPNIEIIVINDGSPDQSQEIIERYMHEYPGKVFGHLRGNRGVSAARNFGIEQAKGEYISFVDGDDYLDFDCIEKMMESLEQNGSDLIICGHRWVDENGVLLKTIPVADDNGSGIFIACAMLYKRQLFNTWNIRFPEGKYYEDLSVAMEARLLSKSRKALPYVGYNYVQRQGSTTHRKMDNHVFPFEELEQSIQKIKDNTNDPAKLESEVLFLFSGLLFLMYQKASTENVTEMATYIQRILKTYFPTYWKNKGVRLFGNKHLPLVKRLAVKAFIWTNRLGILTPFAKIVTR